MKRCYGCMQPIENEKLHTCPHCGAPLDLEAVPPQFLQPGTVLQNKFIVGKAIGSGGFGNTYIGWNETLLLRNFIPDRFVKGIRMELPFDQKMQNRLTISGQDFKAFWRKQGVLQTFRTSKA